MSRPRTLTWFEPYWSHRRRGAWPGLRLKVSRAQARRRVAIASALAAIIVFASGAVTALMAGQVGGRVLLVACAWLVGEAVAVAVLLLLARVTIPLAYRVLPPWVRVSAGRLEIHEFVARSLRIDLEDLVCASVVAESDGRKSLMIRWQGGERTVGLSPRVEVEGLRGLLGDQIWHPDDAATR